MTVSNGPSQRKWYHRVSVWVATVILAAIATFATDAILKFLDASAQRLSAPFDIVAERVTDRCPFEYAIPATGGANQLLLPGESSTSHLRQWEGKLDDWERGIGVIDGNTSVIRVVVTGKSERPVILQSLKLEVLERQEPDHHLFTTAFSGACGGIVPVRYLSYNLDRNPPRLTRSVDDRNPEGGSQGVVENPVMFPYTVSRDDPEVFEVKASTDECDCLWRLKFHWVSGGNAGDFVVGDQGKPFRTVATRDLPVLPFG